MGSMINRRRVMGQKEDYIKDGLVFWLNGADALGGGNSATKWTDRIAGIEFDLTNCSKDNNGGVIFNTYGNSYGQAPDSSFVISPTIVTIEYVFSMLGNKSYYTIFDFGYNSICLYWGINSKSWYSAHNANSSQQLYLYSNNNRLTTISLNNNEAYCNKSALSTNGTGGLTGGTLNKTLIGRFTTANIPNPSFEGTIKQIRVYNRILSSAEMMHNQDIDNMLYHLF